MTVLYVDDDTDDLQLLKEATEEIDSSIVCLFAKSGSEALVLLDNGLAPDLTFLDINMPKMDGVTCLTKIKEREGISGLKFILMSTSFYPASNEKTKNLGVDFIKKPNTYNGLVNVLSPYLKKTETIWRSS